MQKLCVSLHDICKDLQFIWGMCDGVIYIIFSFVTLI